LHGRADVAAYNATLFAQTLHHIAGEVRGNREADPLVTTDQSKRDRYEKEQEQIKSEAERKEAAAKSNFHQHEVFARGVTMFQIAIAIAAISALTRRRKFWIVSLLFGGVGCVFLALAELGSSLEALFKNH
jgi:hypothetical protein